MPDPRTTWTDVADVADVVGPPWDVHRVGGHEVVLVRHGDGAIHAIGNACPHLDAPMTSAQVEGDTVACPRHWYAYALDDGHNVEPGWDRCRLTVHRCRVVDGRVEVAVEEGR